MGAEDITDGFEIRDEEDYEGGGFEDLTGKLPDDEEPAEGEAGAEGEQAAEGEQEPEGDQAGDQAGDKAGGEEEPPADPQFEELKALKLQNEQLGQALVQLNNQVQQLTGKIQQPTPGQATPADDHEEQIMDEAGLPSEADWGDDPTEAAKKVVSVILAKERERLDKKVDKKVGELSQAQQQQLVLQTEQDKAWNAAVNACPELAVEGSKVREVAGQLFNDESLGLKKSPIGPYVAAQTAMGMLGYTNRAQRQGAEAERDRQQRLRSGVMNAGGKGGKSSVTLSAKQRAMAKRMGVKPESYAEAVSSLRSPM